MADKKISELQDVNESGGIDYDNDYTIALRGFQNYKVKIGDIVNETKSLIPKKVSDLTNDAEYITSSELEAKKYLTQREAQDNYALKLEIPTSLKQLDDDIGVATQKELKENTIKLENQIDLSVATLENHISTVVNEMDISINNINITINEAKDNINGMIDSDYLKKSDLPSNVSYFTNDSGYLILDDLFLQHATDEEISSMVADILNNVY